MKILAFDPSGSYHEGNGTTGYAVLDAYDNTVKPVMVGQLKAHSFSSDINYWKAHAAVIELLKPDIVVLEDFVLYGHKALQQTGSRMETSKLIGHLEYYCNDHKIELIKQRAVEVKPIWKEARLEHLGVLTKTGNNYYACGMLVSKHIRDAIRHGMHFGYKYIKEKK